MIVNVHGPNSMEEQVDVPSATRNWIKGMRAAGKYNQHLPKALLKTHSYQ
jgi:hypothetical protein